MADTSVNLCGIHLKNPVMTASGTFGSGREFAQFFDLSKLGGITAKGISITPWNGNPPHRIAETYGGMLNAVGLQNPGAPYFANHDLPFLREYDVAVFANLCGHTIEEYEAVTEYLNDYDIDGYELNISCPNVDKGGLAFGTDPHMVEKVVKAVKAIAKKPLIVKLSPNVTDISQIAKAAESAGADGLSLINTLLGMAIDIKKRKPVLANTVGGLSGPAIKPVALRMVYQVRKAVNIPIVGMGGIANAQDAIEFLMAGAAAISVGSASFNNPMAAVEIVEGIEKFLTDEKITHVKDIVGVI